MGVLQHLVEAQTFVPDQLAQRVARHVLHGDEVRAIDAVDLVNGDDIGVVERRRRPGFLHEAALALRIGHCLSLQHLDGNQPVQAGVPAFVDHAHPALAELFDDLVVRDNPADQEEPPQSRLSESGSVYCESCRQAMLSCHLAKAVRIGRRR